MVVGFIMGGILFAGIIGALIFINKKPDTEVLDFGGENRLERRMALQKAMENYELKNPPFKIEQDASSGKYVVYKNTKHYPPYWYIDTGLEIIEQYGQILNIYETLEEAEDALERYMNPEVYYYKGPPLEKVENVHL